jgi:major type 1 subunit fimbrin (pilin)
MKKVSFLSAAAAVAGLIAIAPAAHASDGKIEFTGMVTALTCTINGGGANNNFSVALPPVSTSSLAAVGSTAGRTPFAITLTNCSLTGPNHAITTYFEPGDTVDPVTGQLIVDAGAGAATNVQLRLLNSGDYSTIVAGAANGSQNSAPVDLDASGNANLNYFVEYAQYGASGATAGPANSRVFYTLTYQ